MTVEDFSNEFDVLLNSWSFPVQQGNAVSPIALNEYEKSVYLTRAQDDIVKSYFSANLNPQREGFGYSRKRDIDFSKVIKVESQSPYEGSGQKFSSNGFLFSLPEDILLLLNEECKGTKEGKQRTLTVVPLSQDEYERVTLRPYRYPYKRQAWRLIHSEDSSPSKSLIEIIPGFGYSNVTYTVRYVRYPNPIILENLEDSGLNIRNKVEASTSELSEEIHAEILARAVELAKAHILGTLQQTVGAANGEGGNE